MHALAGFTVMELMIVVAIVATLSVLVAPDFRRMIATSKVKTAASDLHMVMLKARSHAAKSNTSVTVASSGGNWANGWALTWDDPNDSPDGGTLTLLTHEANEGVAIASGGVASVTFLRSGRISGALPTFDITAERATQCRSVSLNAGGTPTIRRMDCP